jgi:hypothetical protein
MKIYEVTRRGFLKGLAGTAATAATPGGVANLAKTIAEPAAAEPVAAAGASALHKMFAAATMYGREAELRNPDDADDADYDDYDPEAGWDSTLEEPQGDVGDMPWGSYYEVHTSNGGHEYLWTSDDADGNNAIFSFVDKNGEAQCFVLQHDRTGWGDMVWASDDSYYDVFNNNSAFLDEYNEDVGGAIVDAILDGVSLDNGNPQYVNNQDSEPEHAANAAADISRLSRLAGIAKSSYDKLSKFGHQQHPEEPKHMGDEPKQLPAPSGDNTFDFDHTKHKTPVRRDDQ